MINHMKFGPCPCGKTHTPIACDVRIGKGAVAELPALIRDLGGHRAFVIADQNTYAAAGQTVSAVLKGADVAHTVYTYKEAHPEPDERSVGSLVMHLDRTCDIIVGVGSGVINDLGKLLSALTGKPYIIVATAPSMDGFASASSSMTRDGLKVSLSTRSADAVIGDIDILKNAPLHMLKSGIGDMLAKYISIGEWRIAHVITGEYYCERVAELVRVALRRCVENAGGLLLRDERAVEAVFEGLIIGGLAMAYAGVSRPASGVEHYFSHIWDMRGVAFGTPVDLHGIQCGVGTLYAARIYDRLRTVTPNRERAIAAVAAFDFDAYAAHLRAFVGEGAESMIAAEATDGKYDPAKHAARLDVILDRWEEIQDIIRREIPPACEIERLLGVIDAPRSSAAFGIPESELRDTFAATGDIRDKYVASRLCFDLGILGEMGF